MRLAIYHETQYCYPQPLKHLIQLLRLTPSTGPHQHIVQWSLVAPGKLQAFEDGFGNVSHTHVLGQPSQTVTITAQGVVETTPLQEGLLPSVAQQVPAQAFLVPTPLTTSSPELAQFARQSLPQGMRNTLDALTLARAICTAVAYVPGSTDVSSTAQQAFAQGCGVCQDHAHAMIAACHSLGVPARYVSGYVDPGHNRAAASHAWVDVCLPQGWVSVDVTNTLLVAEAHCRIAQGRDYLDASPVRGVREGGDSEAMQVQVQVAVADQ